MTQGWAVKKLGDLCEELFAGGDVQKNNSSKFETDTFNIPIFSNGEKNKGLYGFTNIAKVTKPAITISARGTIGYSEVRNEPFYPAIRLIVVIPKTNILNLFFLKFVISNIDFTHSGSSIPQLTVPMIKEYLIPLPPLPEQQRIVAILDEAFATIAKAKANAEQNLKNAKELFESYLREMFENKNEDWEKKKLGDVCGFVRGPFGGSLKKNIFKPDGYAVYEQQHAIYNQFDRVRYFIDENKFNEMKRFELSSGDLIMSCSGTMGKIAIVPENIKKGIINQALLKLSPSKKISPVFLKLWMQSESFQDSLKEYSGGAAIQNVASVAILKEIEIPLPSLQKQQTIVQKLDALSAETKKLEAIYQAIINNLDELKKSILQKAFSGELTKVEVDA